MELSNVCSVFGPVVSFKLVVDKSTGRYKGYGFCEFRDEESAFCAKRNQEGLLICMGRQLRVDLAHSAVERKQVLAAKKAKELLAAATTSVVAAHDRPALIRELYVYALWQAMKLAKANIKTSTNPTATGCRKRENPSCDATIEARGPTSKKSTINNSTRTDAVISSY